MAPASPAFSATTATDVEDDDFQDAVGLDSPAAPTFDERASTPPSSSTSPTKTIGKNKKGGLNGKNASPSTAETSGKANGKKLPQQRGKKGGLKADVVVANATAAAKNQSKTGNNNKKGGNVKPVEVDEDKEEDGDEEENAQLGPPSPSTPTQPTPSASGSDPTTKPQGGDTSSSLKDQHVDSWLHDSTTAPISPPLSSSSAYNTEDNSGSESEESEEDESISSGKPSPHVEQEKEKKKSDVGGGEGRATPGPNKIDPRTQHHFSLSSEPETPSTYSPRNAFESGAESEEEVEQQQQDEEEEGTRTKRSSLAWRSSINGTHGVGSGRTGFADVNLGEEDNQSERLSVSDDDEAELTKLDAGAHRRAIAEAVGGGTSDGFGFIKQRAENLHAEVEMEAKRASLNETNNQFKQDLARLQREADDDTIDWDFWGRVMANYEEVASTQPRELSRAIQRGIPPALRGMTWQLMAASKDEQLAEIYTALLQQSSPHEKGIARDLNRTFPKHEYFSDAAGVGQQNLFNVVKAYSLYDEEVGYTQGLQFIVGPLLLNMPDEEAFCVLVRLMKSYDLRSHYTPNMPGLQLRLFQFDRLLEELVPGVFLHLLRQGVKSSMYASQWFLTLFGYRFPLELVSSVFDLVFAEGVEAVFRFSIAILKRNETAILSLEFEECIEFLKNGLFECYAPSPEARPNALYRAADFVREALSVKITPLMLDQFGEEWDALLRQQTAHAAELDALRKANHQLSQQVRHLEASLSQINLEHCELVKQVVMAKLEREELEDELVKYKIAYADLSHQTASDGANSSAMSRASLHQSQQGSSNAASARSPPLGSSVDT